MSTTPSGTELNRLDVVGRTIVSIVQEVIINDEKGMDWAYTFYELDSGVVFCLPFQDAGRLSAENPTEGTEPIELESVLGEQIVDVLRDGPESETCMDSPYLVLGNGFLVTDVMGAPHGLGAVGVYVYAPDEIERSKLVEFFT
jgi:hypothetical protein